MTPQAHIIGAGMAGLSAAVRLRKAGFGVTLYEAAPHAGGRCRSFYDKILDATIDNGAHLMLSGNTDILAYLELIGAGQEVFFSDRAQFEFLDVKTDQAWTIDLGQGQGKRALLAWLFDANRRPPGVGPWTLLREVVALKMASGKTVATCLDISTSHFRSFWEPLCIGVLNAKPEDAAAELLWAVFAETVMLGGWAARPLFTRNGLGAALVDPALKTLKKSGAKIHLGQRVGGLNFIRGRVSSLTHAHGTEVISEQDVVIMAVPHFVIKGLMGEALSPQDSHAIINTHFRLKDATKTGLKGVVGSDVHWLFTRGHIASVTMSAADEWLNKGAQDIAQALWPDVVKVLGLDDQTLPAYRVIKERRATFAQHPKTLALRANTKTRYDNLFLAGDWTNTGLPATIEGAVRSGRKAAEAVLA